MSSINEAAAQFLAAKRVAVTGVSRTPAQHGSNVVYQRLRQRGYTVFPVNPNAETVEGDAAYPDLTSIPGGVDAVVIGTRPERADATMSERADATMSECAALGITQVWMHRSVDAGSVSASATDFGRAHGITVIDGGCPLMFGPTADFAHKCMKAVFTMTGAVPRRVS